MATLTVTAPAKINYLLDIISKRPDGYHELRMIMQRVSLCDKIILTTTSSPNICVICNLKGAPDGPKNIAWKAARALLDYTGSDNGIHIQITKNIPVAAGLGGGSSDAAAVLMGMNEMMQFGLNDQILMEIGCKLGADVPFFIFKKTALAEGIGEKLSALPQIPKCSILLVNPCIHVSTSWVYQSLQLTSKKNPAILPKFFGSVDELVSVFFNDLEAVTIPKFPVIAKIKTQLNRLGAVGSLMSGSGPTVFGVFRDYDCAESARYELIKETNWFVATVETM